jgi:hypothetical protein
MNILQVKEESNSVYDFLANTKLDSRIELEWMKHTYYNAFGQAVISTNVDLVGSIDGNILCGQNKKT